MIYLKIQFLKPNGKFWNIAHQLKLHFKRISRVYISRWYKLCICKGLVIIMIQKLQNIWWLKQINFLTTDYKSFSAAAGASGCLKTLCDFGNIFHLLATTWVWLLYRQHNERPDYAECEKTCLIYFSIEALRLNGFPWSSCAHFRVPYRNRLSDSIDSQDFDVLI